MKRTSRHSGFTIIELIVVMVVIGILAGISIISYNGLQERTRDTERKGDVDVIAAAFENYRDEKGQYPNKAQIDDVTFYDGLRIPASAIVSPAQATSVTSSVIWANTTTDIAKYSYMAYQADGTACLDGSVTCTKFTISYKSEQTGSAVATQSKYGW